MLFNSLSYLIFFPAITLVYFLLPWQKVRNLLLLAGSYFFYMCWDPRFIVLMLGCTVITYLDALFIDISRREDQEGVAKEKRRTGRATLYTTVTVIFTLAVVAWFKYANFLTESLVSLLGLFGVQVRIPEMNIALPVGISFFTFQSLSYVIDVYRGTTKAERNFFTYALFVSFFPQLVAGPIERSSNLLSQFKAKHAFDSRQAVQGAMLMLWGYFMKIVVADRVAIVVDQIYNYFGSYEGLIPILGTVLFAFQIYCDFNGYTTIAIGSAQVMGFRLMQNFQEPYLATSVADFWRRWHISLTSWFRDYIFPAGRQPLRAVEALPEHYGGVSGQRPVARRLLDLCDLGRAERTDADYRKPADAGPAQGAQGPAYPGKILRAQAGAGLYHLCAGGYRLGLFPGADAGNRGGHSEAVLYGVQSLGFV